MWGESDGGRSGAEAPCGVWERGQKAGVSRRCLGPQWGRVPMWGAGGWSGEGSPCGAEQAENSLGVLRTSLLPGGMLGPVTFPPVVCPLSVPRG